MLILTTQITQRDDGLAATCRLNPFFPPSHRPHHERRSLVLVSRYVWFRPQLSLEKLGSGVACMRGNCQKGGNLMAITMPLLDAPARYSRNLSALSGRCCECCSPIGGGLTRGVTRPRPRLLLIPDFPPKMHELKYRQCSLASFDPLSYQHFAPSRSPLMGSPKMGEARCSLYQNCLAFLRNRSFILSIPTSLVSSSAS